MIHLLDVNVLIALLDSDHVAHDSSHRWFELNSQQGWATCALTQNGMIRILSQPKYANTTRSPAIAAGLLADLVSVPGHVFWPCDRSLLDDRFLSIHAVSRAASITDAYLLALAVSHGGRLVTLDRKLRTDAVPGGKAALVIIPA